MMMKDSGATITLETSSRLSKLEINQAEKCQRELCGDGFYSRAQLPLHRDQWSGGADGPDTGSPATPRPTTARATCGRHVTKTVGRRWSQLQTHHCGNTHWYSHLLSQLKYYLNSRPNTANASFKEFMCNSSRL